MKKIILAFIFLLLLTINTKASFQYEVVVADQYAMGNVISDREFFVRITQGSGTLYLTDHINNLYSQNQTQSILNNISAFGYINLNSGDSGVGSFDNTIITYQNAMNQWNPVVTQTGYEIGTFSEGDEIALWITTLNGISGSSIGERGSDFVDNEMNWRNWGQHSDILGNPSGQFSFSGSPAIFFTLSGSSNLTGVPLPGASIVLVFGVFGLMIKKQEI